MTNSVNYPNQQQNPAYSGITINITNPLINPPAQNCCNTRNNNGYITNPQDSVQNNSYSQANHTNTYDLPEYSYYNNIPAQPVEQAQNIPQAEPSKETINANYPPQYYMNNYNYVQNTQNDTEYKPQESTKNEASKTINETPAVINTEDKTVEEDLNTSNDIINDLEARAAEIKEKESSSKKVRVVALTNEYIMSLENYLNNPNKEIRLMASKEILKRLDEDKDRYDDAALNALLNKMLQDPEKLIRIAALSALSGQLASGNDYTVKLLTDIQNNPSADKEDAIQAANILLLMSATTEIKYAPMKNKGNDNNKQVVENQIDMNQLQSLLQNYQNNPIETMVQEEK
jgi:hypothetical protein